MLKNIFLTSIAAITVVTTVAMATNGDKTVASKSYVDTKQVMVPAASNSSDTLGSKVVTYTDTAGAVGARGIATSLNNDVSNDDVITAGFAGAYMNNVLRNYVQNNSLTKKTVHDLTCVDNDCELYNVTELTVYRPSCLSYGESATSASQCCSGYLQDDHNKCGCADVAECSAGHYCAVNHVCTVDK